MSKYAKRSWTDNIPPTYLPFVLTIFTAFAYILIKIPAHQLLISSFISSAIALLPAILIKANRHGNSPVNKLATTAITLLAVAISFCATIIIARIGEQLSADLIRFPGIGDLIAVSLATIHILRSPEGKKAITSKPYYRYAQNLQNIFVYIFLAILAISTYGAAKINSYDLERYAQPLEEGGRPYTKVFPNP